MEIDRPTAADYADSAVQAALKGLQGQADASKAAGERLKALETKVKVLATVVDYLAAGKSLESLSFDDAGNAIDGEEWEEITFDQIKLGDEIRYLVGDNGTIDKSEGVIHEYDSSDNSWCVGDDYWVFSPSYYGEEKSTYLRKRVPFEWPNKLGAVVRYEEDGVPSLIICVEVDPDANPTYFHPEQGSVNKYDLEHAENLQTLYEGVTLES